MAPSIFILLHRAADGSATTILSVHLELADANAQCLARAKEAKVDPAATAAVNQPLRWEAPDGEAAWVEKHAVQPRKTLRPLPDGGLQRKQSHRLYDSDEGDAIEVHDGEGHYD